MIRITAENYHIFIWSFDGHCLPHSLNINDRYVYEEGDRDDDDNNITEELLLLQVQNYARIPLWAIKIALSPPQAESRQWRAVQWFMHQLQASFNKWSIPLFREKTTARRVYCSLINDATTAATRPSNAQNYIHSLVAWVVVTRALLATASGTDSVRLSTYNVNAWTAAIPWAFSLLVPLFFFSISCAAHELQREARVKRCIDRSSEWRRFSVSPPFAISVQNSSRDSLIKYGHSTKFILGQLL